MSIYYEDLSIGDVFERGPVSLTKEDIISFAEQFDPQPFHTDEDASAESIFDGLIASGLHTLCLSVRLFVTEFVNPPGGFTNMGGIVLDHGRWHEPVRPDDTLTLVIEVPDMEPSDSIMDRSYVTFDRRVRNPDDVDVLTFQSINIDERRNPLKRIADTIGILTVHPCRSINV